MKLKDLINSEFTHCANKTIMTKTTIDWSWINIELLKPKDSEFNYEGGQYTLTDNKIFNIEGNCKISDMRIYLEEYENSDGSVYYELKIQITYNYIPAGTKGNLFSRNDLFKILVSEIKRVRLKFSYNKKDIKIDDKLSNSDKTLFNLVMNIK